MQGDQASGPDLEGELGGGVHLPFCVSFFNFFIKGQ